MPPNYDMFQSGVTAQPPPNQGFWGQQFGHMGAYQQAKNATSQVAGIARGQQQAPQMRAAPRPAAPVPQAPVMRAAPQAPIMGQYSGGSWGGGAYGPQFMTSTDKGNTWANRPQTAYQNPNVQGWTQTSDDPDGRQWTR